MADVSYNIPDLRPGEVFRVEQTIKRSRFIDVYKRQVSSLRENDFVFYSD